MARKNLFFRFLTFILFLLIFDRGIFYLIRTWESSYYKKKGLKKIFFQKRDFNKKFLTFPKRTYNTLIMGSSRTHRGIHPYYLYDQINQKAFKIAKAAIRVKFNYYFYQEYKKYAGIPKVVIYGLDYFMFRLRSHPFFMRAVADENTSGKTYNDGILLLWSNKQFIDSFFNDFLEQLISKVKPGKKKPNTFEVIDPFVGYDKKKTLKLKKPYRFKKHDYIPYPGREGIYFKKLLKDWQKDGVQVLLVFLPEFIATYETNYQLDLFRKDIRQLTASYKNVFIYDYNDPEKFLLSKKAYFLDGAYGRTNSHLSKEGAKVFNRMLIRDIKKHYYTRINREESEGINHWIDRKIVFSFNHFFSSNHLNFIKNLLMLIFFSFPSSKNGF